MSDVVAAVLARMEKARPFGGRSYWTPRFAIEQTVEHLLAEGWRPVFGDES